MRSPRRIIPVAILALLAVCALPPTAAAAIIRVVPGGVESTPCGDSWDVGAACALQYALKTEAASGDEIWVQAGTYFPSLTDRLASFVLVDGVALYGGFAGGESSRDERNPDANVTVLSGDINVSGNDAYDIYRVVTGSGVTAAAVLDGFTVTKGKASYSGDGNYRMGGGIFISGGSPTISRCIFTANHASSVGGAAYLSGSNATFTGCVFTANDSPGQGGAMYIGGSSAPTISNCAFAGHDTDVGLGGALYIFGGSTPTITDSTFTGNAPMFHGGAIYADGGTTTLTRCTFSGNTAPDNGGAIYLRAAHAVISDTSFVSNRAEIDGGAIHFTSGSSAMISRCTFEGNSAAGKGGALCLDSASSTVSNSTFHLNEAQSGGAVYTTGSVGAVLSSTFAGNTAVAGGAILNATGTPPPVTNTILWGNVPSQLENGAGVDTPLTACIVEGGCPPGSTCSEVDDLDPLLGPMGEYGGSTTTLIIAPASPAVDGGNDTACSDWPVSGESQNGLPRPQGTRCDVGAFELGQSSFRSLGAYDGWILESAETSGRGGTLNRAAATLLVGDDAADRQYRSILAFNTASLPDEAALTGVRLRLRYASVTGTIPFATHGKLLYDIRGAGFSGSNALEVRDFQAPAGLAAAGWVPKIRTGGWYSAALGAAARLRVSLHGQTQFRLRFAADDNDDRNGDVLKISSGNAALALRPELRVFYYVP